MVDPARGDVYSPENIRPLSVVGCFNRIIAAAFRSKLASRIGQVLGPTQRGFVPGKQIIENVLEIDWEYMRVTTTKSHGALVLFDFSAAFPSVDHEYLWSVLEHVGVPAEVLRAYKHLYAENQHYVRLNGQRWDSIKVTSGVRQGCPTTS